MPCEVITIVPYVQPRRIQICGFCQCVSERVLLSLTDILRRVKVAIKRSQMPFSAILFYMVPLHEIEEDVRPFLALQING